MTSPIENAPGPDWRGLGLAAAAYAAFAIVFTWPLAAQMTAVPLLAVSAPFDSLIFLWNFDALGESLAAGRSPLYSDRLFFPTSVPLALHTHTHLYGLLSLPVQALVGGERGLHTAYALCVLGSFTVAGVATFLLARAQGLSRPAAFVAGIAFAWCAARVTNLARLHALGSELLPLALLALQWTIEERGRRGPLLLATCVTALAYNGTTMLATTAIAAVVFAPALWAGRGAGWPLRLGAAAAATLVLTLPLAPGMLEALAWSVPEGMEAQRVGYSLDFAALFWPNDNDRVLGALLPTRPTGYLEDHYSFFVGLPVFALACVALWLRPPVRHGVGWVWVGAVGFVLAIGPEAKFFEQPTGIPLPYAALEKILLPLQVTRVPARFVVLTSLALAIATAAAVDALRRRFGLRRPLVYGGALGVAVWIALGATEQVPLKTFDGLAPDRAGIARSLEPVPAGSAILDLPYDTHHARRFAMYQQTGHGRPILFGAYPRAPRDNRSHFDSELFAVLANTALEPEELAGQLQALDLAAERAALEERGIGAVILHHSLYARIGGSDDPDAARWMGQGRVLARVLGQAWGPPESVDAGFYTARIYRF